MSNRQHLFIPTWITLAHLILGMVIFLLVGCDTVQGTQATQVESISVASRPLATVYISPTPNAEQVRATSLASSPTPTPILPSQTPRPTEYVGIFIGEAEPLQGAIVDPDAFNSISTPIPPTVAAAECTTTINAAYATIWRNDSLIGQRMGCPIQLGIGFEGRVQVFANGIMYQRIDTEEIWVMQPDNPSGEYLYFETSPDVSTAGINPPTGFIVPSGDFGGVWFSQPTLQEAIGFAQTPPLNVNLGWQRFSGGTFFLDSTSGQIFALLADGTLYGPFLAGLETDNGGVDPETTEDPNFTPDTPSSDSENTIPLEPTEELTPSQ